MYFHGADHPFFSTEDDDMETLSEESSQLLCEMVMLASWARRHGRKVHAALYDAYMASQDLLRRACQDSTMYDVGREAGVAWACELVKNSRDRRTAEDLLSTSIPTADALHLAHERIHALETALAECVGCFDSKVGQISYSVKDSVLERSRALIGGK